MNLKEQIENYEPYNEQEAKDKETMLKYINTFEDVLTRNNEFGHFTASSWVVNKETISTNHGHGQVDMLMANQIYYKLQSVN